MSKPISNPLNVQFRIERDSLGEVNVPAGALFGAQTSRAAQNFKISYLRPWKAFIWSMAVIKRSAASVNCQLGLLDSRHCRAIIQACDEVIQGTWDDQFVVDPFQAGAGTSHNMNINEVIANRATQILGGNLGQYWVNPNDHVNMSQSTNDTIPTAIRLGCLWRLDEMLLSINTLAESFIHKGVEFDDIVKSGRTHLQDAVPVRLGQEFTAYGHAIEFDAKRIKLAAEDLHSLGIGGTATGSGLNAHPEYHKRMIAELSSFTGLSLSPSEDLFERMQSLADVAQFSGSLRTLALTLIRIANDLRLLASGPATGLDEIRMPALQPGSSIMPGKVNPVMAEMLNMAMFHAIGCDTTISMAVQAGQLELNVMMPVIAHNIFEMMQIMIGSITAFDENCVRGIIANRQKAEGWLEKNAIIATALNPILGYAKAAELVKEAIQRNLPIREIAIEKAQNGMLENIKTGNKIFEKEIHSVFLDIRRMTDGGIFS